MKTLALVMCAALVLTGLSACSKTEPEDGGDGGATPPADAPAATSSASPVAAVSDSGPGLKAGLWTSTMKMSMGPEVTMKMCVDEAMSHRFQDFGPKRPGEHDCAPQSVVHTGNTVDMSSVCKTDKMTVNTKVHMVMNGDSYHQDIDQTFDPPMAGMGSMHSSIDGTFGGACPSGMKGGDVSVAGITRNIHDKG